MRLNDLQRDRLDRLSKFRIEPAAISVMPSGSAKRGGKAEVVQATFRRRLWNRKKRVAVKKLLFHREIDSYLFANVRGSILSSRHKTFTPGPVGFCS